MKLTELLQQTDYQILRGDEEVDIADVSYDSRSVQAGHLFVAIRGFASDGHAFIRDALAAGATAVLGEDEDLLRASEAPVLIRVRDARQALAVLSDRLYGHPSGALRLIGATGTNGKTSTTMLLKTIFRSAGYRTGLFGTIQHSLDDEILPSANTTPESRDLQEMLSRLVKRKADYAVMEVSSHALRLGRVAGCDFRAAIFTNLSQDHLDFHTDMEDYFQAKLQLFRQLDQTEQSDPQGRFVVLNVDDPYSERIASEMSCRVVRYGINGDAQYRARNIKVGLHGIRFTLETPTEKTKLELSMTGEFTVYNCLAAVAVALEEGLETDIIKKALRETKVPGRFEPVQEGQRFAVVVDYAHTPDSLQNALRTAREVAQGRVIAVFGCGGDRDRTKRPIMGRIGVRNSDCAIVTSDNPRTEDPAAIIEDIVEGLEADETGYEVVVDRRDAIRRAVSLAREGDLVLIAGKGHEDYQIIGTKKYPFSDLLVAREAIRERTVE